MHSKTLIFPLAALALVVASISFLSWQATDASAATDPGANTFYIGPHLWGILYNNADGQTVPENVTVRLAVNPNITVPTTLSDQITDAGGSHAGGNIWTIPTSALLGVIQRADVTEVERHLDGPSGQVDRWPRMNKTLKLVMESRSTGVPHNQAALHAFYAKSGKIITTISIPDSDRRAQVATWLTNEGMPIPVGNKQTDTYHDFTVMLPVNRMETLLGQHDDIQLRAETLLGMYLPLNRSWWTQEARDFENFFIDAALGAITPSSIRDDLDRRNR